MPLWVDKIAAGPHQHSHSWFRVSRDSWPYMIVSRLWESCNFDLRIGSGIYQASHITIYNSEIGGKSAGVWNWSSAEVWNMWRPKTNAKCVHGKEWKEETSICRTNNIIHYHVNVLAVCVQRYEGEGGIIHFASSTGCWIGVSEWDIDPQNVGQLPPPLRSKAVHVIHTQADGTDGENYVIMNFKICILLQILLGCILNLMSHFKGTKRSRGITGN
jgi:hypothetical protein